MVDLEKNTKHRKRIALGCTAAVIAAAAAVIGGLYLYAPGSFSPLTADSTIQQTGGDNSAAAGTPAGEDEQLSASGSTAAAEETAAAGSTAAAAQSEKSSADDSAGSGAGSTQSGSAGRYVSESGETVSEAIAPVGEKADEWNLLLVNPWHLLPDDFTVELADIGNGQQIDARAADDLEEMLDDCREAGYSPYICSSYREYSKQVTLFDNDVRKYMNQGYTEEEARDKTAESVAVPGTSEHEAGLALDIVDVNYQILEESQEDTGTQKWLMEHCWDYGFILRYPRDKTEITGITYEPWHYRYVGRETAKSIRTSGKCLEEYLGIYH